MTVHAIDPCFCGQPATRTIGTINYCHDCAETVLAPLRAKHPSSGGHGQQTGPMRPDWGDRHAELTCDHCGATWVGPIGETCGWCVKAVDEPRRLKLADAPPLYNVSGNGQHTAVQAPITTDWDRHDLVALAQKIMDGDYAPETAEYLMVDGGRPLLYPGRTHSIFGEPGGGKTWIALYAIAERLNAGQPVLLIDWEDSPQGTVNRLLLLGVLPDQLHLLDYRNPVTGLKQGWEAIDTETAMWTLVVIDSTGEAMGADGIKSNDDTPVAEWMALAKRLARTGAAVLLLDHVPKNVDNRDMEIGSQRKQAAITGASYRCDTITSPAKGRDGILKLVVRKDRLGNRAKGSVAAEVHILEHDGPLHIELRVSDSQAATERGERFRPTHLMERVSRWLELHPGATRRMIEADVTGKGSAIRTACDALIEEGFVTVERVGQALEHTSIRDYREQFDGLTTPVDNSPRVPASHRVPTASQDAVEVSNIDCVPASPRTRERDAGRGQEDQRTQPDEPTASPVDNPDLFEDQW